MQFSAPRSCALLHVAMHAKYSVSKDTTAVNSSFIRNCVLLWGKVLLGVLS